MLRKGVGCAEEDARHQTLKCDKHHECRFDRRWSSGSAIMPITALISKVGIAKTRSTGPCARERKARPKTRRRSAMERRCSRLSRALSAVTPARSANPLPITAHTRLGECGYALRRPTYSYASSVPKQRKAAPMRAFAFDRNSSTSRCYHVANLLESGVIGQVPITTFVAVKRARNLRAHGALLAPFPSPIFLADKNTVYRIIRPVGSPEFRGGKWAQSRRPRPRYRLASTRAITMTAAIMTPGWLISQCAWKAQSA
jgi:hypothetical protein